jgi:hypothetical protein
MERISNINVGPPDIEPSTASHTRGVHEGNWPRQRRREFVMHGSVATSTARRSTGINPEAREPIDPSMPNLSPA